jgi:hypothetical protein
MRRRGIFEAANIVAPETEPGQANRQPPRRLSAIDS